MPAIGLFPLELVLVPTERVPLHIFEPRYRELIGECLEDGVEFGLLLEDAQGLREVGTSTAVVEVVHRFDDGRMNVVVEGRDRFRLVELTEGRSFVTAEVEPLEDDDDEAPTDDELGRVFTEFTRLIEVAEAKDIELPARDSPRLSFELAARVEFGTRLKQELIELRSERERLRRLVGLLAGATAAIAREREIRHRAGGNGRVTPSH